MYCPKRPNCFDKAGIRRRVLASSCYPAFFRGHQRVGTPEYLSMMRLRKIWAEGSFSVLKREHCISKIRKRGILAATEECLLAATALNLKRIVNAAFFLCYIPKLGRKPDVSPQFCFLSTGPFLDTTDLQYCHIKINISFHLYLNTLKNSRNLFGLRLFSIKETFCTISFMVAVSG